MALHRLTPDAAEETSFPVVDFRKENLMGNGHEPATKADLQSLKDEVLEAMHDTETRLLKAFYDFAESSQKRLGATETLGALVVTDIEKRLNTPPAS